MGHRTKHLSIAIGTALVVLYVVVRCLDIGLFVTTDEPFWLGRSANFFRAIRQGELEYTYQMAHPGVTTMWAGAISFLWSFPRLSSVVQENISFVYGIGDVFRSNGQDPMELLIQARLAKIILSGVAFLVSLIFLRRLFGVPVMALTGALIALDPWVSGHDSLLHVDGLFAIASFAAILALAYAARSRRDAIGPWFVAGVLAAFAWMTRATGVVLGVVAAITAFAPVIRRSVSNARSPLRERLESPAFSFGLWTLGGLIASLLLLPALLVDPFGTLDAIWNWSSDAAAEGHERPLFFRGEVISGDPGWLFYPVTLAWRLTPVVLFGVVAFVALITIRQTRKLIPAEHRQSLLIIAGFGLLYFVLMTFGAKKFDRYVLPVYPILMLLAAYGGVLLARVVVLRRPDLSRFALPAVVVLMLAGQSASLAISTPYRMDYASPLLGGLDRAQHHIQVGWGEGAQKAVAFIVEDADGATVTVQSSSNRPLLQFVAPETLQFPNLGLATPAGWYETDYFVAGIQEWQRNLSASYRTMQANDFEPIAVIEVHGVPFFEVFAPNRLPLPASILAASGCDAVFGGGLRLAQVNEAGGAIDFYFVTTGDLPGDLEFSVTFEFGAEAAASSDWVVWRPAEASHVSKVSVPNLRQDESPPLNEYRLLIQVRSAATGELLTVESMAVGSDGVTAITDSDCFKRS